jgi:hypothetical protein
MFLQGDSVKFFYLSLGKFQKHSIGQYERFNGFEPQPHNSMNWIDYLTSPTTKSRVNHLKYLRRHPDVAGYHFTHLAQAALRLAE